VTRNDAVVHLQHVQRTGKRKQVDYSAEYRDARQPTTARVQLSRNYVVSI